MDAIRLSINTKVIGKIPREDSEQFKVLTENFTPVELTADDLSAHIKQGHAFIPAVLKVSDGGRFTRNNESFNGSELIGLDIDNSISVGSGQKRRKTNDEGYVTFENFTSNKWFQQNALLIYTTHSHSEDWHRFRIVLRLPRFIENANEYKATVAAFIKKFNADESCSSVCNTFYGNPDATIRTYGNTLTEEDLSLVIGDYVERNREERKARVEITGVPEIDHVSDMLQYIRPDVDYVDWVRVISAIGSKFDKETTVQLVEAWSPGYIGEVAYKYDHKLSRVGFGTLVHMAKKAGWTPPQNFFPEKIVKTYPLTDSGNKERFVDMYRDTLRYEPKSKKWYIWDGKRFKEDETGKATQLATDCVRSITADLPAPMSKDDLAKASEQAKQQEEMNKAIRAHAKKSESRAGLENLLTLASKGTDLVAKSTDFDQEHWLLNLANCTFDLRSWTYDDHDQKHLITKLIDIEYDNNVDYDAERYCPKWLAFLRQIMNNDEQMVDFLQRALGYSLSGLTSEQCLFFCYGTGKNGKSVFFDTVKMILGDYYQKAPTEMLMLKHNDSIPNDVARLRGERFVVTAELPESRRFDESRIKDLTGGDRVSARFLHGEFFEFDPTHTIWIYGNHKPSIVGTDDGIWRRIHLIPFTVTIREEDRRPTHELMSEFMQERSAILRWMMEGFSWWQDKGLETPKMVNDATLEYKTEMNSVGNFLRECITDSPGEVIKFKDMYTAYTKWCEDTNEYLLKSRSFNNKLRELKVNEQILTHDKVNVWMNVQFRPGIGSGVPF